MLSLPEKFWIIPRDAITTITTKQLKEVLLQSDGVIIAQGQMWDIVSKRIGPGVHSVRLKEHR